MCGIVGILGPGDKAKDLTEGLALLEYRGYDSAGLAVCQSGAVNVYKTKGKIKALKSMLDNVELTGRAAVAHTRWATHGEPNDINAHPHVDCKGRIAVVHNGIIENFALLKDELLKKGHKFLSETDTEVIPHLIEEYYQGDLFEALKKAVERLKGSYAIAAVCADEPDVMVCSRKGSPLVLGVARDKIVVSSDVTPLLLFTKDVVYIDDDDLIKVSGGSVYIENKGRGKDARIQRIEWDITQARRCGFPHFMKKEIHEQPVVIGRLIGLHIKDNEIVFPELEGLDFSNVKRVYIVGCGTAYHAGLASRYLIESLCGVPVEIDVASELRYRDIPIEKDSLCIAISQSGETADTLAAVEMFKRKGVPVLAICNVIGSSLTRLADYVVMTHAGIEISVASTKAYTAQLSVLSLLVMYVLQKKGSLDQGLVREFLSVPEKAKRVIAMDSFLQDLAKAHHNFGSFLYLGRKFDFPTALEGALKLKEISYIPAEGYPAGEMKHGPIALIDEYRAVICIATDSDVYDKVYSNLEEIKARNGKLIALASEGNGQISRDVKEVVFLPKVRQEFAPIVNIIALQIFAYYVAVVRGCHIDQPRNLAKSVTVE